MYEHFERLGTEKRDAILNAALEEFALRGYDLASTNEIVKGAGISKGALFHYFGDKRALFAYLCDCTADLLRREYYAPLREPSGDLVLRLQRSVGLRMTLLSQYPRLFAFTAAVQADSSAQAEEEIASFRAGTSRLQQQVMLGGLDDSLIREDIPAWEGNRMLWWILEGYSGELTEMLASPDTDRAELEREMAHFHQFLPLLRRIFYRNEG